MKTRSYERTIEIPNGPKVVVQISGLNELYVEVSGGFLPIEIRLSLDTNVALDRFNDLADALKAVANVGLSNYNNVT